MNKLLIPLIGVVWGCTNVYTEQGLPKKELPKVTLKQKIRAFYDTLTTPSVLIPFLINQVASISFYILLGNICNDVISFKLCPSYI